MNYKICILSDSDSWINLSIVDLVDYWIKHGFQVKLVHKQEDILAGDFCFILGCTQILKESTLKKNKHNLVVHESKLPHGKGWSPLSWQILEGKNIITISLFEAEMSVDSGVIYIQEDMRFEGHELVYELRKIQLTHTINLCKQFVSNYPAVVQNPIKQRGRETFYPKRPPADSILDINSSILNQFNLLRIVDNKKYPAYFEINGCRYKIRIDKVEINI